MKLAIVGSTQWGHILDPGIHIRNVVYGLVSVLELELIISGDSPYGGVDSYARQVAYACRISFQGYPPERNDWPAFKKRNAEMVNACTHLVALRSLSSTTYGSGWTADQAEKQGKKVWRIIL